MRRGTKWGLSFGIMGVILIILAEHLSSFGRMIINLFFPLVLLNGPLSEFIMSIFNITYPHPWYHTIDRISLSIVVLILFFILGLLMDYLFPKKEGKNEPQKSKSSSSTLDLRRYKNLLERFNFQWFRGLPYWAKGAIISALSLFVIGYITLFIGGIFEYFRYEKSIGRFIQLPLFPFGLAFYIYPVTIFIFLVVSIIGAAIGRIYGKFKNKFFRNTR